MPGDQTRQHAGIRRMQVTRHQCYIEAVAPLRSPLTQCLKYEKVRMATANQKQTFAHLSEIYLSEKEMSPYHARACCPLLSPPVVIVTT
jgi:hypothetical protein